MNTVLAIAPHFPSPDDSSDGQANYMTALAPFLSREADVHLQIIALQVGSQAAQESGDGWTVQRIPPPKPLNDIFSLYLSEHLVPSLKTLAHAASAQADALGTSTPVWCHGYETGEIVEALSKRGHHVVAVVHYSVGVETIHDLALGDDTVRREAFDSPWATLIGRVWPTPYRNMGVRWASRIGNIAQHAPLPMSIQTQFTKLALERKMVANASRLVAVSPSFEQEINSLYPCTVDRSTSVIAGVPTDLPPPLWPHPIQEERRRIIMVGRPTGQKGWDYAAQAFKRLSPQEAAPIDLVLIGGIGHGNGPYSAYSEHVAHDFDCLEHIRVDNLGALSHRDTLAHLAAADLLLFPSVFEPFGLVLLEAMSTGCCVLASNAAGPSDVLRSPWGITMNFQDPNTRVDAITQGIQSFLSWDRDRIRTRSSLARRSADQFSWRQCASVHSKALMDI